MPIHRPHRVLPRPRRSSNSLSLLSLLLVACSAPALAPEPVAPAVADLLVASDPTPVAQEPTPAAGMAPRSADSLSCDAEAPKTNRDDSPLGGSSLSSGDPNIMGPYFSDGFGFYPVAGAPPGPRTAPDPSLELTLSGAEHLRVGEKVNLKLEMANNGGQKLVIMRPLDGSLERWRGPTYVLYLRDIAEGKVYRFAFHGGRCGNVNPIGADDYAELKAGERRADVAENGWASHLEQAPIPKKGSYALWVVYSVCGGDQGGVPLGEDQARIDVTRGVHVSNAVWIRVE